METAYLLISCFYFHIIQDQRQVPFFRHNIELRVTEADYVMWSLVTKYDKNNDLS